VPYETTLKERITMTFQRRILVTSICVLAVLASVVGVGAQATREKSATFVRPVIVQSGGVSIESGMPAIAGQEDNTFVFVSSEMSFDGKTVKGAPYSAQAVSESVQTLADGNRIVHRDTSSVYRDGEGRTRREQTLGSLGAYTAASGPTQMIFINDPVAGVNYILDSNNHTAQKMDLTALRTVRRKMIPESKAKADDGNAAASEAKQKTVVVEVNTDHPGPGEMPMAHSFKKTVIDSKDAKKESLGKQTIEGVEAEGTRLTITIAAGQIGNEAPINMVSETWYSPDLQTVVMSKHSDPRSGEHTYRLTNINRSEPAHSLFEVPSDFTIKETAMPNMQFKFDKEIRRSGGEKQQQ
jgi:hypothetical protein